MINCTHFTDLLQEQTRIMQRHLERHKYFQHIIDLPKAEVDFVEKFGWLMREMYCDLCPDNRICEGYKKYIEGNGYEVYERQLNEIGTREKLK